jgi:nucleoside permease NupC
MILRGVSEVPTVLILIGIICLAAVLVVEILEISIDTAIAMGGLLFLGVVFCPLAWWVGISGRAARPDQM